MVDLGDHMLTVHLPGHSPTSIALFDEHNGVLFPGDVVYEIASRELVDFGSWRGLRIVINESC